MAVTVTDNGEGALEVSDVTIEKRIDDEGHELDTAESVEGTTVTFTNTYDVSTGTTNIDGVKSYIDTTGGNQIDDGEFTFRLEALGGYETVGGSADNCTVAAEDVPMPAGAAGVTRTVTNTGNGFGFGQISYDGNDVGKTFVYKVTEVSGNEPGMTYDRTVHTVEVSVAEVTTDEGTFIVQTVLGKYTDPDELKFSNTYDPEDVTLSGASAIHGTKILDGRELLEGEKFYFTLSAVSDNAKEVLANNQTVSIASLTNGSADFSFNDLTFSRVGTYVFQVDETAENGSDTTDGNALTYSRNVCTVTVNVTDNGQGSLEASAAYANVGSNETGKAVFTNVYTSDMNYGAEGAGGTNITKQMLDRPMAAGEFTFVIAGTDSTTVSADDAGKTFSYLVSETVPADGDKLPAVAYDQTQYRLDIAVYDNGDGTMHTLTTVTKVKDESGIEIAPDTEGSVIIDAADSSAEGYTAPTFGFVNDYDPDPAVISENANNALQVTKTVTGAPSPDDTAYTFTLTATGDNVGDIEGLDTDHFTEPGDYTYLLKEAEGDAAGMDYDDTVHTVTAHVTDKDADGNYTGHLAVTWEMPQAVENAVTFNNEYTADPASVTLGTGKLIGNLQLYDKRGSSER